MKKEKHNYHYLKSSSIITLKMTKRYVIFLLILFLGGKQLFAIESSYLKTSNYGFQQSTISGTVTDEKGNPLPGVNIQVEGTTTGVMSDINGKYAINVPDKDAVLIFSFVGYESQKISVSGKTAIDIKLVPAMTGLDEVVVVGYGTQKKVNLTGAVDIIESDELARRQASTVSQMLQGLSPSTNFSISGQDGYAPGAEMNITIRGIGSLNGGSPYVLINGVPGDLNNLNPDDIATVSVLKDAASSAIYGAKAAYGVILVTTKSGRKDQKMGVNYQGTLFLSTPPPLPESLDSYTWVKVMNEAGDNRGGRPFSEEQVNRIIAYQNGDWDWLRQTAFVPGQTNFGPVAVGNGWNPDRGYANNKWYDIYYGQSVNQKHDLSVQGGSNNISYFFSTGYLQQNGYLNFIKDIDFYHRLNITAKIDVAITPWWDFSYEPRLTNKIRTAPGITREGDYSFMFREISRIYPFVPLYDGFGNDYMQESHIPSFQGGGTNSLQEIDTWNNFRMEFRPVKGWKINADYAYNYYQGLRNNVQKTVYSHNVDGSYSPRGASVPNYIDRYHYNNTYWTANIYSSYGLTLNGIHNFLILAGTQFEYGYNSSLNGLKNNLILQDIPSIQTATGTMLLNESLSHKALEGYFGRFTYNFKEKYLFEADARYDGSYVFRSGNRWGFFPSFSLGWNLDKEGFWTSIENYVNTMKVRLTWGSLGNQNINPYTDLELLPLNTGTLNWVFGAGNPRPVGFTIAPGLVNKNLTWETATTKNIGTDISFLKSRLTVNFDLYERLTTNMIGPQQALPGVLGASVPNANNSTLRTRGWELTTNWKHSLQNGFSYSLAFNLSNYKSIVTKYYNPTGTLSTWYEGREVGEIWGFTVNDLYRSQQEVDDHKELVNLNAISANWRPGDLKYEDINGDGKVDRGANTLTDPGDLSIIGNDQPHYIFGINAGASFKGLDFTMLWRGVAERNMYFDRYSNIFWGNIVGWWDSALQPRTLDYFRDQPGTKYSGPYEGDANINLDGYFPRPYQNGTEDAKNKNNPNSRYLQSAAYARLQNIQLGYTLPQSISSKLKLEKLRVAFSAENLFTITKLPDGIDPVAPVGYGLSGSGNYFGQSAGTGRLTYGADRMYSFTITVTY